MKVVKPVVFDPAIHLVSSNAVETYAAWNAGTTYAKDAIVDYGTHLYQSLVNSNLNNNPETSPIAWVNIGPDNTHAMFDNEISTATVSSSPLTIVLKPGYINSIGLFGLVGNQVSISITDGAGGPVVYSKTISLDGTIITDWYQYFYEPSVQLSELVLTDLPAYLNARLTITVSGSGDVQIGTVSFGTLYDLGMTQYDASVGIIDYSKKETDANGKTTFVKRAFSKRMNVNVMLDNTQLNKVQSVLSDLRATPCIWIGSQDSDYNVLLVYGFYRDFSISIPYPSKSLCSLEIEGLT